MKISELNSNNTSNSTENNNNDYKNGSLILTDDNISLKNMVDQNLITTLKLKLNLLKNNNEIELKTKNFIFKGKKGKIN